MKPIEIEIIPIESDSLSVSVAYPSEPAPPLIRRWQVQRKLIDSIVREIEEVVTSSVDVDQFPKDDLLEHFQNLGLGFFEALLMHEADSLLDALSEGDKYLLFKVDRSLAYLPFEALFDGRQFLSLSFTISRLIYSPHSTSPIDVKGQKRGILIVGDPSDDPLIRDDVEREIDILRDALRSLSPSPLTILVGREVDEAVLLANLNNLLIFHFTGHGIFGDHDERSGLLLRDEGVLTAQQISGLQIPPRIVFLNCCAAGSIDAWRTSIGLIETLLLRGTKVCVAPIWTVTSISATTIAQHFYHNLIEGKSFGEALRLARVAARNVTNESDLGWAAYTLYGDPLACLVEEESHRVSPRRILVRNIVALLLILALILLPGHVGKDARLTQIQGQIGYLIFETTPKSAKIIIDGKSVGLTPLAVEVEAGRHKVIIEKQGYRRWEATVDISPSEQTLIEAELEPVQ